MFPIAETGENTSIYQKSDYQLVILIYRHYYVVFFCRWAAYAMCRQDLLSQRRVCPNSKLQQIASRRLVSTARREVMGEGDKNDGCSMIAVTACDSGRETLGGPVPPDYW